MSGSRVRPLRPADRAPLREALAACPEFSAHEVDVAVELIDAELGRTADYAHLVAELDEPGAAAPRVAGYVCVAPIPLTDHAWNLYWICVHPRLQGHGVGRCLMAAAEAHVRGAGGALLVLETSGRADYAATRAFYAACGWEAEARIRDFYRSGDDIVYYVRRLDASAKE
ncbi:MAG TPA: GNAT family N-acetyltransferase [Myxococcota bacterium]|jgi:ribosomal protein S18 acetylase RimI-like enzyme|nr:GNAT family N-acetyltransferase [Myxococcota bacterium]